MWAFGGSVLGVVSLVLEPRGGFDICTVQLQCESLTNILTILFKLAPSHNTFWFGPFELFNKTFGYVFCPIHAGSENNLSFDGTRMWGHFVLGATLLVVYLLRTC